MVLISVLAVVVLVLAIAWLSRTEIAVPRNFRGVLGLVLGLILVGMLLWLVNAYIPMAGSIKGLVNIVVLIACCIWVLQAFGIWSELVRWSRDLMHRRTPPREI
jgi:predicted membrane protein